MILLLVTLTLAASNPARGLAAEDSVSGPRIDLRQIQDLTIASDAAASVRHYDTLQVGPTREGDLSSGVTWGANQKLFATQFGVQSANRVEQNGGAAQYRAARSGLNDGLDRSQGDLEMHLVTQGGDHNKIAALQSGNDNTIVVDQTGSHNSIAGYQTGSSNSAVMTQAGTNQTIVYLQSGTGSTLTIRQR